MEIINKNREIFTLIVGVVFVLLSALWYPLLVIAAIILGYFSFLMFMKNYNEYSEQKKNYKYVILSLAESYNNAELTAEQKKLAHKKAKRVFFFNNWFTKSKYIFYFVSCAYIAYVLLVFAVSIFS